MALRAAIRKIVEKATRTHILPRLPRGVSLNVDLHQDLPWFAPDIIFDVGANVGQSALEYLDWFPRARVYCFEPAGHSFSKLQENLKEVRNVRCFPLALGDTRGQEQMLVRGTSAMNALYRDNSSRPGPDSGELLAVEITTLSEFCSQNCIEHISFLKIDTEGHDLAVLRGAGRMLDANRIDLIQVEAGMNPDNRSHVPFEELKSFLEAKDYCLFGIYEQISEWPTKEPHLRRTNPVFLARTLLKNDVRSSNRMSIPK